MASHKMQTISCQMHAARPLKDASATVHQPSSSMRSILGRARTYQHCCAAAAMAICAWWLVRVHMYFTPDKYHSGRLPSNAAGLQTLANTGAQPAFRAGLKHTQQAEANNHIAVAPRLLA